MDVRRSPFVGRADELAVLTRAMEGAAAGTGGVALLRGEAGIGKTRLVDELALDAERRGWRVLRGWAMEHEHDRPFGVVLDALRSCSPEMIAAARAAAAEPSDYGAVDQLVDVIESVTSDGAVLLALEDLHWADPLTMRFVLSLGLRASMLPLLVLGVTRPAPPSTHLDRAIAQLVDRGAQPVSVEGLCDDDVAELAAELLGEPPGASLLTYLHGASGNPLFVTELIGALGAQGTLSAGPQGVEAVDQALPPPLRLTILRCLDHASPSLIELLRLAAVLGTSFTVRHLAAVSRRSPTELLPLLDEALRTGVLIDRADRIVFRHDVLQESIYQDVPLSTRRALHRDFADRLADAGADTSVVAEHLAIGADPGDSRAVGWLLDAAVPTPPGPLGAVPFLERARSLCRPGAKELPMILAQLAVSYAFKGRLEEAAEASREALRLELPPEVAALARAGSAATKIIAGQLAPAVDELVAIASVTDYPLDARAEAMATAAYFSVFCLQPEAAIDRAHAALALIPGDSIPLATSTALQALALATMAAGNADEALALATRARAYVLPYRRSEGTTFALVSMLCNDLESARAAVHEDLVTLAGTGDDGTRPILHFSMAMVHYLSGDLDAAVAEAAAGQALSDELETGLARTLGLAITALIAVHRDEIQLAGVVLDEAVRELEQYGVQFGLDLLLLARALHAQATGNDETATTWLVGAWELAGSMRAMSFGQLLAPELLSSIVGRDDVMASGVVAQLDELASRNPAPVPRGIAALGRAMIERDGDLALGGVEVHRQAGFVVPHARVCELAAEVLIEQGRHDEAASLLGQALDIWEGAHAGREEARVGALLRSIGVRRRRAGGQARAKIGWDALTSTELKVARLVADGLTSRDVGARLFISRRTVETHLSHIFAKLGVSNRSQVAAIAAKR